MKLCECGCGQPTKIASRTSAQNGHFKGQPIRFLRGHNFIKPRSVVDEASLQPGTRAIPLTQGLFALVDDSDFDWLNQYVWLAHKSRNTWYAERAIKKSDGKQTTTTMHKFMMGKGVDHRDGNGLNNQRSNLRLATQQQNHFNQGLGSRNTSGYKGVHWDKRESKWCARIGFNGKKRYIGHFAVIEDAARAYDAKARELHGEFARLNFPEQEGQS